MANYLCIYTAPDSHIDFMHRHPDSIWAYIEGTPPEIMVAEPPKRSFWQRFVGGAPPPSPALEIPDDWPTAELTMIGPEINHRNVDLYHLILNGRPDFVEGSGSIFQTWLTADNHSAVDLGGQNENFAFKSHQLPGLVELLSKIDTETVKSRFIQWLRAKGDSYDPTDEECEEMTQELKAFAEAAREAVKNSQGLIWVSG